MLQQMQTERRHLCRFFQGSFAKCKVMTESGASYAWLGGRTAVCNHSASLLSASQRGNARAQSRSSLSIFRGGLRIRHSRHDDLLHSVSGSNRTCGVQTETAPRLMWSRQFNCVGLWGNGLNDRSTVLPPIGDVGDLHLRECFCSACCAIRRAAAAQRLPTRSSLR
jgi:hypothetical protein